MNEQVLEDLDHQLRRRGASPETARSYRTSARMFLEFLKAMGRDLATAGTGDAVAFAIDLRRRGLSRSTVAVRSAGVAELLAVLARVGAREAA